MAGGGDTKTKQEPWGPQQPYLEKIFREANRFYNTQQGQGPWTGNIYAPEDPRTGAARGAWYEMNRQNTGYMDNASQFANNNINLAQTQGQGWLDEAAGTVGNYGRASDWASSGANWNPLDSITGFSNETLRGPSQPLADIYAGGRPTGRRQLDDILAGGRATGNAVLDALAAGNAPGGILGDTLSGQFMDPNNALIQNYMDAATRPVQERLTREQLPGLDSAAIASGAYGGSANAVQRGQAIGDTNQAVLDARSNILYQNMQAERDRQQQIGLTERQNQINAAGNERGMQFQGLTNERNNQFQGLMGERGIEAANFQQRQNLLQQDRGMQLQGLLQKYGQDSSNMFNAAAMEQARNSMLAGMGNDSYTRGFQSAAALPSFFQAAQMPYQNMSQIGDMFTNSGQRELDNARGMFDLQRNFNWDTLSQLQGMINGNYGMSQLSSGGGGGGLAGAAGGALTGGTLGAGLGYGAGGSGAALAGAMGMSAATGGWAIPLMLALAGGGAGYLASS